MVVIRQAFVILVAGTLGFSGAAWGQALAGDPPGRVGRLAFTEGTVSFHDSNRTDWGPAVINQPLTTGDAIWTEPKAHSEISISGSRVRLDGATQLDMAVIDDQRTRLQLDQGRVDIKTLTFDARQPYELVTPRGVAALEQQGDYYVEAGSTQDPTRLGVRQGAAQFQAPDGRVLAVRAGEVAEITGDGSSMELHTIQAPPPPMPQYWAARDRVVVYDQPPQYLSASVTGYEDLNYYGTWTSDPEYGQVWYVREAPQGWAPYTTGRWISDPVYGWTWVDEQPWGFAPYHYGRWAHRGDRWFWVPPERSQPAIYAPALVAFIGGVELGQALSVQNRQPVGWFPLGPREIYVPPYTANRDYYRRLNLAARVEDRLLENRWDRIQRHEAIAEQNWINRRFATVVPADAFARSQPVQRVALRVAPEKIAAVPVAAVAVPPSPTVSVRAIQAPSATAPTATTRPNEPGARVTTQGQAGATASTQPRPMIPQALKPEPTQQKAPGPQIATRAVTTNTEAGKPALPKLEPRNASAPPPAQIQGERKPATTQPGGQQATAPANQSTTTAPKPGEPPKPGQPQANAPAGSPAVPPLPGEQNKAQPGQPNQANLPPVRERNGQRPEPPRPGQPQATTSPQTTAPNAQPPKPGESPKSPQATTTAPQPPKPGEPPKSPQATTTAPQPPKAGEPPKSPQATTTAPQPPKPGEPPKSPQAVTTPQPPHQATPPAPQPQQQQQLQRQPAPSQPPQPSQTHATPPAPPPPQPQHQAAPAAPPPPQQAHAPAPPPQPQHQAAPAAPPPQAQAPHPAPPPPQQAQGPHPQPAPQAQPQQKPAPQPGQKPDEKKQQ
jgi:hypothetical protein